MNILISGSQGLIGRALSYSLTAKGHTVCCLVRSAEAADGKGLLYWDPARGILNPTYTTHWNAIVHLGGTNIASGRWTPKRKKELWDSRIESTALLARVISQSTAPPEFFLTASAVGYYGSREAVVLTEEDGPGTGFLPDLCVAWEKSACAAASDSTRVAHARFGVVLSSHGGALAKMLTPFKLCLGGPLGTGTQYMSWISLQDAVRAIEFALNTPSLSGPINIVAPNPVTNEQFTSLLAHALSRPAWARIPRKMLLLLLGEMAEETLLASTRAIPNSLQSLGFSFLHSDCETALNELLR